MRRLLDHARADVFATVAAAVILAIATWRLLK